MREVNGKNTNGCEYCSYGYITLAEILLSITKKFLLAQKNKNKIEGF